MAPANLGATGGVRTAVGSARARRHRRRRSSGRGLRRAAVLATVDLDREVRSKIKNLSEGTATFEIEYQRVMEQMKAKKGL